MTAVLTLEITAEELARLIDRKMYLSRMQDIGMIGVSREIADAILSKWTLMPKGGPDSEQAATNPTGNREAQDSDATIEDALQQALRERCVALNKTGALNNQEFNIIMQALGPAALGTMSERERKLVAAANILVSVCANPWETLDKKNACVRNLRDDLLAYTPTPEPGK